MRAARYQVTMEKLEGTASVKEGRWTSLWVVALVSLLAQLWLCQFFSLGQTVPETIDVNPSNLWKFAYQFPPTGSFQVLNWLGVPFLPQPLNPLSLAAEHLSAWCFFTAYAPVMATLGLLAMAAFLQELELPRPAALFGGVIMAWQSDILTFVYPGHFGYITMWFFFAIGAWAALRAERTGRWAYPVISGASCGIMVGLLTNADRGSIACLLIAALYLEPIFRRWGALRTARDYLAALRPLALCVAVAALIALAPMLALFKSNIVGVKIAGAVDREQTYKLVTQYSIAPEETLTYLVPGFFGWHINNHEGPYWGWIGEWPDWEKTKPHEGTRNMNLAICTVGTVSTVLALIGAILLVSEGLLGPGRLTERQRFYGRILLVLGFITLVLGWGWHTGFYRPLFALPLMDKWRDPLKWLEITNFALIVLSAIGLQHLLVSLEAGARIVRQRLAFFTLGVLILLGLGLAATYPGAVVLASALQAEGCDPDAIARMMNTMHTSTFGALVVTALLGIVLRALWRPEQLRGWTLVNPLLHRLWQRMLQPEHLPATLALSLAALAALQLGWVASQFVQPESLEAATASNPMLEALRSEGNTVRFSVETDDPLLNDLLLRQMAALNISSIDISAASRIPDDLKTFFDALSANQARLWFLAGVKNVAVPELSMAQLRDDPDVKANMDYAGGYTLVPTGSPDLPSHALVKMKDFLAKATLVPHEEIFTTDEALLKRLKDPAWVPRQSVLLNPGHKLPFSSEPGDEASSDQIDLKTYTPTEIKIDVKAAKGGYVLVNDQYDPDWQAQVNGREAELLRADYILRAVQVPPGDSTVTLHYFPHYHVAGLSLPVEAVSDFSDGAMLAAWVIAGIALLRKSPL